MSTKYIGNTFCSIFKVCLFILLYLLCTIIRVVAFSNLHSMCPSEQICNTFSGSRTTSCFRIQGLCWKKCVKRTVWVNQEIWSDLSRQTSYNTHKHTPTNLEIRDSANSLCRKKDWSFAKINLANITFKPEWVMGYFLNCTYESGSKLFSIKTLRRFFLALRSEYTTLNQHF